MQRSALETQLIESASRPRHVLFEALVDAIKECNPERVEGILDIHASRQQAGNTADILNLTDDVLPFFAAQGKGFAPVDLNKRHGFTPLHLAINLLVNDKDAPNPAEVNLQLTAIIELLLKHGANPNSQTKKLGFSALHILLMRRNIQPYISERILSAFLAADVNPDLADHCGGTIRFYATKHPNNNLSALLGTLGFKEVDDVVTGYEILRLTLNDKKNTKQIGTRKIFTILTNPRETTFKRFNNTAWQHFYTTCFPTEKIDADAVQNWKEKFLTKYVRMKKSMEDIATAASPKNTKSLTVEVVWFLQDAIKLKKLLISNELKFNKIQRYAGELDNEFVNAGCRLLKLITPTVSLQEIEDQLDTNLFTDANFMQGALLFAAVRENRLDIAKMLVKRGAKVTEPYTINLLRIAVEKDYCEIAKWLTTELGITVNKEIVRYDTIIQMIHLVLSAEMLDILVAAGANPHAKTALKDQTLLHLIFIDADKRKNRYPIAEALLRHGANPNTPTAHNQTPFFMSFTYEHGRRTPLQDLFLKHGGVFKPYSLLISDFVHRVINHHTDEFDHTNEVKECIEMLVRNMAPEDRILQLNEILKEMAKRPEAYGHDHPAPANSIPLMGYLIELGADANTLFKQLTANLDSFTNTRLEIINELLNQGANPFLPFESGDVLLSRLSRNTIRGYGQLIDCIMTMECPQLTREVAAINQEAAKMAYKHYFNSKFVFNSEFLSKFLLFAAAILDSNNILKVQFNEETMYFSQEAPAFVSIISVIKKACLSLISLMSQLNEEQHAILARLDEIKTEDMSLVLAYRNHQEKQVPVKVSTYPGSYSQPKPQAKEKGPEGPDRKSKCSIM